MMNRSKLGGLLLLLTASGSYASTESWDKLSDLGAYGLIGTSLAMPLYKQDTPGFWQAGFSVGTATGIGLVGKTLIDAERPDKSNDDSFPSNHSAGAFAAATTLHKRYGWQYGLPAYSVATLVAVGRVKADKHYTKDVIAGALIGSLAGWYLTDSLNENVQLTPWYDGQQAGLNVSLKW